MNLTIDRDELEEQCKVCKKQKKHSINSRCRIWYAYCKVRSITDISMFLTEDKQCKEFEYNGKDEQGKR